MRDISGFRSRNMFKRKHQRIWLLCGIFALALLLCYGVAFAAEETPKLESWIDHAADGFAGGTGTEDDPYLIATAEQLAYLAKTTNQVLPERSQGAFFKDAYFKLTADIDLDGRLWEPIAKVSVKSLNNNPILERMFCGNFDGAGYAIRNMKITEFSTYNALFGTLAYATIKNLHLENVQISGGYICGGFAGFAGMSLISNCTISGDISALGRVGGVAGLGMSLTVERTSLRVNLLVKNTKKDWDTNTKGFAGLTALSSYAYVGSIVGAEMGSCSIIDCVANAEITILNSDGATFGEFFGKIVSGTKIVNCDFSGHINGKRHMLKITKHE